MLRMNAIANIFHNFNGMASRQRDVALRFPPLH